MKNVQKVQTRIYVLRAEREKNKQMYQDGLQHIVYFLRCLEHLSLFYEMFKATVSCINVLEINFMNLRGTN